MNTYLFHQNEQDFLSCFLHESIILPKGSPVDIGDTLVFFGREHIMGWGKTHLSSEDGETSKLFVSFDAAYLPENRLKISEPRFQSFFHRVPSVGRFTKADNRLSDTLSNENDTTNDLGFFLVNAEHLLEEAETSARIQHVSQERQAKRLHFPRLDMSNENEHQQAQFLLNEIGNICGLETWTASNDKNRTYGQRKLGSYDIAHFPSLSVSEEAQERIELIDNVWIKDKRPTCLFEVESSTPIFSGLLRMVDVATVLSTHQLDLYIVAPEKRAKKFLKEIRRPVFQQLRMDTYCHFISIESLHLLYQKIKGLDGYVHPDVLHIIRQSANQLENIPK